MKEKEITASGTVNQFEFQNKKTGEPAYGYNIKDSEDDTYTTFSSTIKEIFETEGVTRKIKYEEKQQGQYINYIIKDVADESGNFNEKGKSYKGGGFGGKADPAKMSSIERQVALKCAVEVMSVTYKEGDTADPADILAMAKDFKTWLAEGDSNAK